MPTWFRWRMLNGRRSKAHRADVTGQETGPVHAFCGRRIYPNEIVSLERLRASGPALMCSHCVNALRRGRS